MFLYNFTNPRRIIKLFLSQTTRLTYAQPKLTLVIILAN